jgi:hypothetical protein
MLCRVVWQKFTGVSEVLTASIIRAIALIAEAGSTFETLVNFCQNSQRNIPEDILFSYSPP